MSIKASFCVLCLLVCYGMSSQSLAIGAELFPYEPPPTDRTTKSKSLYLQKGDDKVKKFARSADKLSREKKAKLKNQLQERLDKAIEKGELS